MTFEQQLCDLLPWLVGKARVFTRMECEDLAADTVLRLLEYREIWDGRDIRPWALVTMRNLWINRYKRITMLPMLPIKDWDGPVDCPHDGRMLLERIKALAATDLSVQCLLLSAAGYSHSEIAQRMGITQRAVTTRVYRARKMIQGL